LREDDEKVQPSQLTTAPACGMALGLQSVPLEVLDRPLVLLGFIARGERAEISSLSGLRILLSRIKPILP
jgi:hypothetical protein